MTGAADEEVITDYESDPEEVKMSLNMRRREASDDEQEESEIHGNSPDSRPGIVDFDVESNGEGAADDYNDGEEEEEDDNDDGDDEEHGDEYHDDEYDVEQENGEVVERGIDGENAGEKAENDVEVVETVKRGEEKAKEVEPFAIPTSGAFYMHDDRFRDRNDGKNRRTFGGKKLWELRDERKWGHDKFEELNLQDRRHYEEGRRPARGSSRGRGKARGTSSGNGQGNKVRGFSGNRNQNTVPKDVRGRGPRRYQPSMENAGETQQPQYKQSARSFVKSSRTGSGRRATPTGRSNVEHDAALAKKVGSNLSSASAPFYPSRTSTKEIPLTQKKEVNAGNYNRNFRPSADPNYSMPISNPAVRGKNAVDYIGIDKLHIDGAVRSANTKANNISHLRSPASSSLSPQTNNQMNKVSLKATQSNQRRPVQSQVQSPLQAPSQQLTQHPPAVSQSSSPPKAGKRTVQGTGRASLGGKVSASPGDPNMPTFFPVMQFGSQHPSEMGVPAVGMAFPGYVGQPNGLGNSDMTWLPMLASAASAAGALEAPYCPPYLSVDGNSSHRSTGQIFAVRTPSEDNNLSASNNEINYQQSAEVGNDQFNQRQNKPRRYSEMKFSQ